MFDILDALFADVDDYCADPVLRAEVHGLDDGELLVRAGSALEGLVSLMTA